MYSRLVAIFIFCISLLFSVSAWSMIVTISVPATDSDGAYAVTMTYQRENGEIPGSTKLYERKDSGGWVLISEGAAWGGQLNLSGRTDGTYSYKFNGCVVYIGCKDYYSNSVVVTLPKPPGIPGFTVPASDPNGAYSVSWTAPTSGDPATSYRLEEKIGSGSWSQIYSGLALSKSFSGKADNVYSYRIRACNSVGCSAYSAVKITIVANAPGVPVSISGIPATNSSGEFTVSWAASSGSVTKYELNQQKDGGSWGLIYSGTGTSKAVSGLIDGIYAYRVRACKTVSTYTACSGYRTSGSAIVAIAPSVPPSISGVPGTSNSGSFTISWGVSTGSVDKYELYQQKDGGSWTSIFTGAATSKAVSGLGDGTYIYRVRACNTVSTYTACSGYRTSGNSIVAIPPGSPASISGVSATNNNGSFTISWGTSTGTVDGYKLEQQKDGGSWSNIYTGTGTSSIVSGQTDGVYIFRVRAYNTESTYTAYSGYRTSGSAIVAIAPGTPGTISGIPGTDTDGAFGISWTVPTGAIDKYELEQQKDGGSWGEIFDGTDTSMSVTGLVDGTYKFQVRACNVVSTYTSCGGYKTSGASIVAGTPAIPGSFTGLPASDNDGSFTVTWGSSTGADTYELEQKKDSGSWVNIYTGANVTKSVSSLSEGTYSFRVRACNTVSTFKNCSSYKTSSSVIVIYPPSVPASISTPVQAGGFTVSWLASTGTVTRYTLQEKVDTGAWVTKQDIDALSYAASGIAGGKNYTYQVRACNDYYCSAYKTGTQTYAPYPAPVINLFVSGVNLGGDGKYPIGWDGIYTVAWTISGQLSNFTLQESADGTNWQVLATSGSTVSFSKPANYGPGDTDYLYRMQACNVDGCSAWKIMTAAVAPYPIPNGPGNIATSSGPTTGGSYTLTWGASNGPVVTHYTLQARPLNGSWGTEINVGNNLQYPVSGKVSGDTYQYRVKACNTDQACSNYSDIFNVYIPYAAPSVPIDLQVDIQPTSDGNFIVSWSASTGYVEAYQLEQRYEGGSWIQVQNNSTLSYIASGSASGDYEYRVRACNIDACSAYVDTLGVYVPYSASSVPESLELTVAPTAQGELSLAWQASVGRVDNYVLEQRYNGSGSWTQIQSEASTLAVLTGVLSGNNDYRVKACNVDACSAYSGVLTVYVPYPAPGIPSGLQVNGTVTSAGNFTLEWADSTGAIGYYIIEHRTSAGSWLQIANPAISETVISGAPSGNNDYRIKACNSDNCSVYAAVFTVYVPYPPPSTPSGLSITSAPTTSGDFAFAWSASSGKVDYYVVEHRYGASGTWEEVQNDLTTSVSVTGIDSGDSQYRVKACNSDACSTYSMTLNVYVPFPAPSVPGSLGVIQGPSQFGELTLGWAASTGKVDNYRVELRKDSSSWSQVYSGISTQLEYVADGSGDYEFRVRACNSDNCSAYSSVVSLTIEVIEPPESQPSPVPVVVPSLSSVVGSDKIGVTAGQFRVNESGAATYSIPLAVPTGTAGVTPEISFNYVSNSANGLLGQGWSVGGLSAVTRCRQTMAQDGVARPISWTNEDRFCLDGQRLIVEDGYIYGADGANYRMEIDSYLTVTSVGGAPGHPNYFKVVKKDGSESIYGDTTDSKYKTIDNNYTYSWSRSSVSDSVGNEITFEYQKDNNDQRISAIRYAYGAGSTPQANITFNYEDRTDPRHSYIAGYKFSMIKRLSSVEVTDNDGLDTLRTYNLRYMPTSGTFHKISRLEGVQECGRNNVCLNETTFTWTETAIQRASSTTGSINLSPKSDRGVFDYKPADINGDGYIDLVWLEWDQDGSDTDHQLKYAVSDGSRLSLGYFSDGSQEITYGEDVTEEVKLKVLDYNADGRQDVLVFSDRQNEWRIHLSLPRNDGSWKISATSISSGIGNPDAIFMDVNSDGLPDVLVAGKVSLMGIDASKPISSNQRYKWSSTFTSIASAYPIRYELLDGGAPDFNGDGVMDVWGVSTYRPPEQCVSAGQVAKVCTTYYNYYAMVKNGSEYVAHGGAFYSASTTTKSDSGYFPDEDLDFPIKDILVADLNGDGLADYIAKRSNTQWFYAFNNGAGFSDHVNLSIATEKSLQIVDYNLDGYPDIAWRDEVAGKLYLAKWKILENEFSAPEVLSSSTSERHYLFLDMTGDGIADQATVYDDRFTFFPMVPAIAGPEVQPASAIVKIDNGLGSETLISYGSLVDSGHYAGLNIQTNAYTGPCLGEYGVPIAEGCTSSYTTVDSAGFYTALNGDWTGSHTLGKDGNQDGVLDPVFGFMAPVYIVTAVEGTAPAAHISVPSQVDASAKSKINYYYGGAKLQAMGRGYLGFEKLLTVDEQTGVQASTFYRQDFPYIGYPVRTDVRTKQGNLLSRSENTWKLANWNGGNPAGPFQIYLAESVESNYELKDDGANAGSLLKTVTTESTYDGYGNPTHVVVTTEGGGQTFIQDTVNDYGSDEWHKRFGRLQRVEATSTRPGSVSTRTSAFSYHSGGPLNGLLKEEIVEPDSADLRLTTTYGYDVHGNKQVVTKSGANTESRAEKIYYDSYGRYPERTENALGQVASRVVSRSVFGQPTKVEDINDVVTTLAYGNLGRKYFEAVETGASAVTTFISCDAQCPASTLYAVQVSSNDGAVKKVYKDALGRDVRTATIGFDGQWILQDVEYDSLSRVKRQSEPYYEGETKYWTTFYHDILGRVIRIDVPSAVNDVEIEYSGFAITTRNVKGQIKTEKKNALGEPVEVVDNMGGRITYEYDSQGNLTKLNAHGSPSDPHNIATTLEYDLLSRKVRMDDPDKGEWAYQYNAFGELISQTDAKQQASTMGYDLLGRMISRVDRRSDGSVEGNTLWNFDTAPNGLGKLASVEDAVSGYIEAYTYDQFGRLSETGASFGEGGVHGDHYTKVTYDQFGRVFQNFDTAGDGTFRDSGTRNIYNQFGFLAQVVDAIKKDGSYRTTYYTVEEMDARGNVARFVHGNGITTTKYYDPATGRLEGQIAGLVSGIGQVQELSYAWDELGNLADRIDRSGSKDISESFGYDGLNRLISSQVTGQPALTVSYDSLGNIETKSDVGSYSYGLDAGNGAGPHAVILTSDGNTYSYDANGNMESDNSRTIAYSTFDKPLEITKSGHTTRFEYGPNRSRYLREDTDEGGNTITTLYLGNVEKVFHSDRTEFKRYIHGVAIVTETFDVNGLLQGRENRYLHRDHLGSLDVITDELGEVETQFSFDPWGQRRNAINWQKVSQMELVGPAYSGLFSFATTRGYTGHEMLDEVGLIHMNGRIYDARLGRFMQADPFVQAADDTQMLNRYSYVRNNPLAYTDSSGYKIDFWSAFKIIAAVVVTIVCEPCGPEAFAWAMAATQGTIAGLQTAEAGGSFGDIAQAALTSAAVAYAGAYFGATDGFSAGEIASLSFISGVASVMQGGKFGHAFVSAGIGALVGGSLAPQGGVSLGNVLRGVASMVVSGTISKMTGGKFANGAVTAAFQAIVSAAASGSRNRPGFTEGGVEVDYSQLETAEDYQRVDDYLTSLEGDVSVDQTSLALARTENNFRFTRWGLASSTITSRDVTNGLMRNAYLRSSRQVAIGGGAVMSFGLMPVSTVSGVAWHALDTHLKGVPMTVEGAAASILIDRTLSPGFGALGRASGHGVGEMMWNINQDLLGYGIGQMGP